MRIVLSLAVWLAVAILCILLGDVLLLTATQPAAAVGALLKSVSSLIGLLAGLFYFLKNGMLF